MIKDKIRIDFNKSTKLLYYIVNIFKLFIPNFFYKDSLNYHINNLSNMDYIKKRVNYYNKINEQFDTDNNMPSIKKFKKEERKKTYYFDLLNYLKYFDPNLKISYIFGDIIDIPDKPTLLKSRPINGDNSNSVLMKLNAVRHFIFVNDTTKFEDKKNILVWRGKCYKQHRIDFIKKFHDNRYCNIGQTNTKGDIHVPWQKEKLSLNKQLKYKFILAIEGNDVASNLKWAMSSNSLVLMAKPKYETWFMEGLLKENYHYALIKDDYSDLEEKIRYYSQNIKDAKKIIKNANNYVQQFKNTTQETIISLLVLKKYFEKSKQI